MVSDEIKDYELEYPELRLITEEHKIEFFNALNSSNEKEEMKKNCDLVIDKINKDIRFTGNRFMLVMIMNCYMLEGATEMLNMFGKLDI